MRHQGHRENDAKTSARSLQFFKSCGVQRCLKLWLDTRVPGRRVPQFDLHFHFPQFPPWLEVTQCQRERQRVALLYWDEELLANPSERNIGSRLNSIPRVEEDTSTGFTRTRPERHGEMDGVLRQCQKAQRCCWFVDRRQQRPGAHTSGRTVDGDPSCSCFLIHRMSTYVGESVVVRTKGSWRSLAVEHEV